MGRGIGDVRNARDQGTADALGDPIDAQYFLGGSIKLKEMLTNLAVYHPMPDSMSGKTSIAFVYESALEALLLFCLRKTLELVLRVIGMNWKDQPSTKQKRH
jgi:hypothetical protein